MIRNAAGKHAASIHHNRVLAQDGEVGFTTDVLFDDHAWTVRYLTLQNEDGLDSHQTLITPQAVSELDRQARALYVAGDSESVRQAPRLEANLPVAAQQEAAYFEYLGAAPYWSADPAEPVPAHELLPAEAAIPASGDPHLRSAQEVSGYDIETTDGFKGHVEDLLLDDESWRVRYLVVDPRDWLPAKKVLLPLPAVSEIRWGPQQVSVNVAASELKEAPIWEPEAPLDRDYETRVHEHYGETPYWVHE